MKNSTDDSDDSEDSEMDFLSLREGSVRYSYGSPVISSQRQKRTRRVRQQRISNRLRVATNAAALASNLFFSGILFGWAPLKLILLDEHQYDEYCNITNNNDSISIPCVQQLDRFNLIFTVAQFLLSFCSLPVGWFLDYASKPCHYVLAALFEISGLLLFATSNSTTTTRHNDHFVLAYSLLAMGGCLTMLGSFPSSFLLPMHQPAILAAISCLFDAASVVFTIFYQLYSFDSVVFSRQHLFTALAGLGVIIYGSLIYCWWQLEASDWTSVLKAEEKERLSNERGKQPEAKVANNVDMTDHHATRVRRLGIHDWPLTRQLCSFEFVLVVLFVSTQMLRCNFYIETVNELLNGYGDENAFYANIFSFVLPGGIVFVPVIEATVRRFGVVGTLHVTNALGVLFGALLLVPSLPLQAVNFGVFACFRAFLYASLNTFIAFSFGVRTMGRVIGTTFTTAAICTLFQYPAAAVAERADNFMWINVLMLASSVVPIGLSMRYAAMLKMSTDEGEATPLIPQRQV